MSSWKRIQAASSFFAGWKNRVPEYVPLIAGVTLTVLAVLIARQRITSAEKNILAKTAPREIVVAAEPVPMGSVFSLANIAKKSVPSVGTSRRNVFAKDFALLLGAKAGVAVSQGEPILWTDVREPFEVETFSRTIPEGHRAVTIDADGKDSFAGLLRTGDHVDLLRQDRNGRDIRPLLSDVPVIAVNRHFLPFTPGENDSEIATITVCVTPKDAVRIAAALRNGKLSWLLRNPDDAGGHATRRTRAAPAHAAVEIWKAGIPERKPPATLAFGKPVR